MMDVRHQPEMNSDKRAAGPNALFDNGDTCNSIYYKSLRALDMFYSGLQARRDEIDNTAAILTVNAIARVCRSVCDDL